MKTDLLNFTVGPVMASDEVLAVAYQYTYMGNTYQVGEFASDIASTEQSLYVKMLKATTINTQVPMWDLMMKNVYSLGAYQLQRSNFKLNIKYLNDTTGTELYYINEGNIYGVPLLRVMNLDRLDANNDFNPDGRFDFLDGYTITTQGGKVIFPVVEPFGSHLRKMIGNDAIADKYVYEELYRMQLTEAQQVQDKNKFVLAGEYQATNKNTISLNATNVPRGSVIVTAGGVTLTENSDYTVDYTMGTVTITNQSIIDAGTNISVSLENQSTFSTQRKTLLGLDLDYAFNDMVSLLNCYHISHVRDRMRVVLTLMTLNLHRLVSTCVHLIHGSLLQPPMTPAVMLYSPRHLCRMILTMARIVRSCLGIISTGCSHNAIHPMFQAT